METTRKVKWDIEKVKRFIHENSDCTLISDSYKNTKEKLLIKCKCGNNYEASFEKFRLRNKRQCNLCSGITNWDIKSVKEFIELESKSGCKLLSNDYKNMYSVLTVMCSCGKEYNVKFTDFKNANARQCPDCGRKKSIDSRRLKYSQVKEIVENSKNGCLLISKTYKNNSTPLDIRCKCGIIFKVSLANFVYQNNQSCGLCRGKFHWDYNSVKSYVDNNTDCRLITQEYINIDTPMKFICSCGEEFVTTFSAFKHSNKTSCNKCSLIMSKSEMFITQYLTENNISFISEYRFEDCKNILPLPFDFAVLSDVGNIIYLIEADGKQHFKPVNFGGISDSEAEDRYEKTKINDSIKNQYCKDNNIPLLRIPYWEFDNIEKTLNSALSHCRVDNTFYNNNFKYTNTEVTRSIV